MFLGKCSAGVGGVLFQMVSRYGPDMLGYKMYISY